MTKIKYTYMINDGGCGGWKMSLFVLLWETIIYIYPKMPLFVLDSLLVLTQLVDLVWIWVAQYSWWNWTAILIFLEDGTFKRWLGSKRETSFVFHKTYLILLEPIIRKVRKTSYFVTLLCWVALCVEAIECPTRILSGIIGMLLDLLVWRTKS